MIRKLVWTLDFMPHSPMAASASVAFRNGMPLETVTAAAGWPAECTFATYYKKDVKEHTTFVYTWLLSLMILVTLISYHC